MLHFWRGKFGTAGTSLISRLNEQSAVKVSTLVPLVGNAWNQLVVELNGWLHFGKNLEIFNVVTTNKD